MLVYSHDPAYVTVPRPPPNQPSNQLPIRDRPYLLDPRLCPNASTPPHTPCLPFRGRPYLLDRTTHLVYEDVPDSQWPELVGRMVGGRLQSAEASPTQELFVALNQYLQENRVDLQ